MLPRCPEPAYRRRGLALTALQLLLSYATSPIAPPFVPASSHAPLPVPRTALVARIGETNGASIALFAKLGFVVTKRVAVFGEVEMRYRPQSNSGGGGTAEDKFDVGVNGEGGVDMDGNGNSNVDGNRVGEEVVKEGPGGTVAQWQVGDVRECTI